METDLKPTSILINTFQSKSGRLSREWVADAEGGFFDYGKVGIGYFDIHPDGKYITVNFSALDPSVKIGAKQMTKEQLSTAAQEALAQDAKMPVFSRTVPLEGTSRKQFRSAISKALEDLKNGVTETKITPGDVDPLDHLVRMPGGRIRDKVTGKVYENFEEAAKAKGIRLEVEAAPEPVATKAGLGDPTGRRGFLQRMMGAGASAILGSPEKAASLAKAAEIGNEAAGKAISSLVTKLITGDGAYIAAKVLKVDGKDILYQIVKGPEYERLRQLNPPKALIAGYEKLFNAGARALNLDSVSVSGLDPRASALNLFQSIERKAPKELVDAYITQLKEAPIRDLASLHFDEDMLKSLEKAVPGFTELVQKAKGKELWGSINELGKGDAKQAAKAIKAKEVAELNTQVEAIQRPTGKELQRTPLPLGEEGKGGVMMRFSKGDPTAEAITQTYRSQLNAPTTYKEGPLAYRQVGIQPNPAYAASTTVEPPGIKPTITYTREWLDNTGDYGSKEIIHHEKTHAGLGYFDLSKWVDSYVRSHPMGAKLHNAFSSEVKKLYGDYWPEEVYTYLSQAIRGKNERLLTSFAEADDGRENVLTWTTELTKALRENLLTNHPDSVPRRAFERQLQAVVNRAGTLADLERVVKAAGEKVDLVDGKWSITKDGNTHYFSDRKNAADFVEANFTEPLTSPSLVEEGIFPQGSIKASVGSPIDPTSPPVSAQPISMPEGGRVEGGLSTASFFFTPFYNWLEQVATKNKWPELYETLGVNLKRASVQFDERLNYWYGEIKGTKLFDLSADKRKDLSRYLEAPVALKPQVARELNLTPKELKIAEDVRTKLYDPAFQELGIDPSIYVEDYVSRIRKIEDYNPDAVRPSGRLVGEHVKFFGEMVRNGDLDPRERDLGQILLTYFRAGLKKRYMGPQLEEAAKLVNRKAEDGTFMLGSLQPMLKRHVEYMRGRTDFTQRVLDGTLQGVVEAVNKGIGNINKALPSRLQISPIDLPPDALQKMMLFSYAGTMGLRPMVPIRDGSQLLLTTYPLLGGKYLAKGLAWAFPTLKEGTKAEAFQLAQKYNALMFENPIHNLVANEAMAPAVTKATKVAETMLKPLMVSNNSNRLIAFGGHSLKVRDALAQYAVDQNMKGFLKRSDMWFLDKNLQQNFTQELGALTADKWEDFSYRVAKELVDTTQWNYQRGASPGLYKYAIGRLLGQYGTWPMNYVNYITRLARQGDPADRAKLLGRLGAAHYGVLASLQAAGIDGGQWVFTQPMGYTGGPLLQTLSNIPSAVSDFETFKGDDARKELKRQPLTMVPGGLQLGRLYDSVVNDSPDLWKSVFGFAPMKPGEEDEGWHSMIPEEVNP